jgi:hypothetical protein
VVLGKKSTAINLHIQPQTVPFMNVLNRFVPRELAALESQPVSTMATVAKWESRKVTIDGSGVLANGLFLRLERDFGSSATYDEIAHQLHDDEEELFAILGIEENRG